MHNTLASRIFGYVASLILTLIAFSLVILPNHAYLKGRWILPILCLLALLQAIIQAIFFLHLLSEKGPRWNLLVFASTVSIILIILVGSIWIMDHLNANMMAM